MTTQTPTAVAAPGTAMTASVMAPRRRPGPLFASLAVLAIVGVGAGVAYFAGVTRADVRALVERVHPTPPPPPPALEVTPRMPWDGLVTVSAREREAVGFRLVSVRAQTDPLRLELSGTTDYDQNALTKVRPLFDARVQRVFTSTGQTVKKGEPLVELYSNELAAAKNDLRKSYVQWDHDHKLLESRRSLAEKGQITQLVWVDTQNSEKTSRLLYIQARDKLVVYGLEVADIESLTAKLVDDNRAGDVKPSIEGDDVHDISRMTLHAPTDGIVVQRDVVSGNFYDGMSVLMVIAPMDRIWVWGNLFEKDQDKVRLGQAVEVRFPFSDRVVEGKVEQVETRVDPVTRTVRLRATIPNPGGGLKADMLVGATVMIPPITGQTVIPRNALAVIDGETTAFSQRPDAPDKFERRRLEVAIEASDGVVVSKGLTPGEVVVSNGSLILSQLYEDLATVDTGLPPH